MKPQDYRKLTQPERRKLREAYAAEQDGFCIHCSGPLDKEPPQRITAMPIKWSLFPGGKEFLRYPVHLHHDHKTGMTLGAVHAHCNANLWQYHGE